MKRLSTPDGGFSLLQLSILLAILAVLAVTLLPVDEAGVMNRNTNVSMGRIEKVKEAMVQFSARHGRIPCPADATLAPDSPDFGREAQFPGNCTGGTPSSNFGPTNDVDAAELGYVVGGAIPTRSLQISDEYAFDGYNNRYSYYVDRRATEAYSCKHQNVGDLQIVDDNTNTTPAMYTIVSHGANGFGAFPYKGGTTRFDSGSSDTAEEDNASVDATFALRFDNRFTKKQQTEMFDDVLVHDNQCCKGDICSSPTPEYNGAALFAGTSDGNVRVFAQNATTFAFSAMAAPATLPINSVMGAKIAKDNRFLMMGSAAYRRNGSSLEFLGHPTGMETMVGGLSADSGTAVMLSALSNDGLVYRLKNDSSYELQQTLSLSTPTVSSDISEDGNYIVLTQMTDTPCAHVYKLQNGVYTLLTGPDGFASNPCTWMSFDAEFSRDADFVAITDVDTMKVFSRDNDRFEQVLHWTPPVSVSGVINSVAWSPDSKYLAIAGEDTRPLRIFKRTRNVFTELTGGNGPQGAMLGTQGFGVSFSSDGRFLAYTFDAPPYIAVYRRTNDSFANTNDPALVLPSAGGIDAVSFRN